MRVRHPHGIPVMGMGLVTSVGSSLEATWSALLEGSSGCRPLSRFPVEGLPVRIAATVAGADRDLQEESLAYTFAGQAINEALASARMSPASLDDDTALVVGLGGDDDGGDRSIRNLWELLETSEGADFDSLAEAAVRSPRIGSVTVETIAPALAKTFNIRGEVHCVATACAAGAHAVAIAADLIESGAARRAIAVGADAMITRYYLACFSKLGVMSCRNDHPESACRPFDSRRQGFVMGEGAGAMVLGTGPSGADQVQEPQGYIRGYGVSTDAYSFTDKDPEGTGLLIAIRQAMEQAGAAPEQLAYINAHGTGTAVNDSAECVALRRAFGDSLRQIPISSIKGQIGHTIAASGTIEAVVTLKSLLHRLAPGTSTLEQPSEDVADLRILPAGVYSIGPGLGMSISSAFGGVNVCLILAAAGEQRR